MKECTKCGITQERSEFYKQKGSKDGSASACKSCAKAYNQTDARKNTARKYKDSEKGKTANERYHTSDKAVQTRKDYWVSDEGKAAMRKWRGTEAARERRRAYSKVKSKAQARAYNALMCGEILRATCCESCGSDGKLQAHHDDYARPLEVRHLCIPCHNLWHKENGEGLNG